MLVMGVGGVAPSRRASYGDELNILIVVVVP